MPGLGTCLRYVGCSLVVAACQLGSRAQEEEPPTIQRPPPRQPQLTFSPAFRYSPILDTLGGAALVDRQAQWATSRWRDMNVVKYGLGSGWNFNGLDSACNVSVQYGAYQLYLGAYRELFVFPYVRSNRVTATLEAQTVSAEVVSGGRMGGVVSFPFLGYVDDAGRVVLDTATLGATPGVADPTAPGLILLSHGSIRNSRTLPGIPSILAHEMVHLLTGHHHRDGSPEELYWSQVMNVYSEPGLTLPVWDGRSAPGTSAAAQDWRPERLTLVETTVGGWVLNQCAEARASSWLHQ